MIEASVHKISTKENLKVWLGRLPHELTRKELEELLGYIRESNYLYIVWFGYKRFEIW